jgi:CPA1 family monovalent cation:H+ antiporter
MNGFDTAAILIAIAALSGYVNNKALKLPRTSGTLAVALVSSLIIVAADEVFPRLRLGTSVAAFMNEIDFNETLMHGMLAFLLFAGALHVDLGGLLENKWTIAALSTVGVLLSTAIVGVLTWSTFMLIGSSVPLLVCLTFGALISPTDPVAVMGLLKELRAPASLEAQIAGESLFNDGVGVVVFFAMASLAGLSGARDAVSMDAGGLAMFFAREVAGGAAIGLGLGYAGYLALKSIDDHPLELLITLALAMFVYSLSFWIHVSGPIAVVTAGLLIGNPGRKLAMSNHTRERIDAFWSMIDEVLNALLFLLLGLQVFEVPAEPRAFLAALLTVPIALLARATSVVVPVTVMNAGGRLRRGIAPVLTWSGLRGGISVAMMLSLPPFPARSLLLACTYAVVVFSVLVQGLTVRRVLVHYGIGETPGSRGSGTIARDGGRMAGRADG